VTLRRGFSRRGQLASSKRKTAWGLGPGSSAVTQVSATTAVIMGLGAQSTVEGATVVRIRGEFFAALQSVTAVGDGFIGAFGIGIAQVAAFDAGVGSVPTPVAEAADENWLYHRFFSCMSTSSAGETWANGISNALRVEVDSKAMRRFDVDRVLYASLEVAEIGTAAVMDMTFDSRVLVKLP